MKFNQFTGWGAGKRLGGGPRWRLIELADHLGVNVTALNWALQKDPDAPKPVGTTNQRSQPGGPAVCPTYSLYEFKRWWKARQQKDGHGTA